MERKFYVYALLRSDDLTPFYVGKGMGNRATWHRQKIKIKKHHNPYLQNYVHKLWRNGLDYCECILCDGLLEDEALGLERIMIAEYRGEGLKLCNLADGGNGASGIKHDLWGEKNPFYGKKHAEESKQAMSRWKKENYLGNGNPFFGKKHSLKSRIKASESKEKKISGPDVLEIASALVGTNKSMTEIANEFGISDCLVLYINQGKRRRPHLEREGFTQFPLRPFKNVRLTPEKKKKIRDMLCSGISCTKVIIELQCGVGTVYKIKKELGNGQEK
jgi:DNA invertase Pin-like site-specific DNA recombinase